MDRIGNQELFNQILEIEDELLAQGMDAKRRHFDVPRIIMRRLGFDGFVIAGEDRHPILVRIHELQELLYRKKDVAIGGLHGGIFMFRGIVARIDILLSFGTVRIEPLKMSDLSEHQVRWLCSKPQDIEAYIATFADIYDFAASVHPMGGYDFPSKASHEYLVLASFQLQSAAATLVEAFDTRGAVQSAMIAAELALKGALAGAGTDEDGLKNFGHNIAKTARVVGATYPKFDLESVMERTKVFPNFVHNRYSPEQPDRVKTGEIVMASQFVCGEVARALTNGSFATKLVKG